MSSVFHPPIGDRTWRNRAPHGDPPGAATPARRSDGPASAPSPVSRQRLRERLAAVWDAMADQGLDCLIVSGRGLISQYGYLEYLIGFCPVVRLGYAVILPGREPVVVMSTRSDAYFAKQISGFEVRVAGQGDVISDKDSMPGVIEGILREQHVTRGRLGVVGLGHIVASADADALRAMFPDLQVSDATRLLNAIKAIKTREEYDDVRAAGAVADAGIRAFMEHAAAGVSGWDLYGEMERAVRRLGAREVLVFVGTGPYFLHRPHVDPLRDGDLVTVYLESTAANGYWVERAGLFTVGQIGDRKREYAETCLRAHRAAQDAMVVGNTASDVTLALEAETAALGALPGIWHGHGVGVDHDTPVITSGDQTPIEEGMVISVHPNLTDPEETVGASVADTYIVTARGAEAISQIPQALRPIGRS
ncbi:M24 family metallopeptidase [Nocardioides soli]|uniref:Xaa-Pro aminopeptidase n=1 Tax=Nocardioides soli TaxID=1036020 RepID=A0A7W4VW17_9ACTN|nr:M24 family metallopeptidase [Nocardioides soli]MBB3042387.1 Xaa-Pro aminopeptidase [Nocardioides soli]